MDRNEWRMTWSGRKRYFGRSGACKSAPHEEGKRKDVAI